MPEPFDEMRKWDRIRRATLGSLLSVCGNTSKMLPGIEQSLAALIDAN
jgi:hypothetical protein